jgi:hypothetical protein
MASRPRYRRGRRPTRLVDRYTRFPASSKSSAIWTRIARSDDEHAVVELVRTAVVRQVELSDLSGKRAGIGGPARDVLKAARDDHARPSAPRKTCRVASLVPSAARSAPRRPRRPEVPLRSPRVRRRANEPTRSFPALPRGSRPVRGSPTEGFRRNESQRCERQLQATRSRSSTTCGHPSLRVACSPPGPPDRRRRRPRRPRAQPLLRCV